MVPKSSELLCDSLREMLTCLITTLVFVDPVLAEVRYIYDRAAITKSLARKPISPFTRQPMNPDRLYRLIKNIIENYYEKKLVKVDYTIRFNDGVTISNQDNVGKS